MQKELYELVEDVSNTFTKDTATFTLSKENEQAVLKLIKYFFK